MGFKDFIKNPKKSIDDMKKSWKEGKFKDEYVNPFVQKSVEIGKDVASKSADLAVKSYDLAKKGAQKSVEFAKEHTPQSVKDKVSSVKDKAMGAVGMGDKKESGASADGKPGGTTPEGKSEEKPEVNAAGQVKPEVKTEGSVGEAKPEVKTAVPEVKPTAPEVHSGETQSKVPEGTKSVGETGKSGSDRENGNSGGPKPGL